MKVNLIISIDTECDKDVNWNIPQPVTFDNILYGLERTLIPLFDKFGIKATYLLSPEILHHDGCVEKFKSFRNIELGTHLHGEFIEPGSNPEATDTHSGQATLSRETEFEKMYNLTQLFRTKFGYAPLSFRAGRFGISKHTFAILNELEYKVDSSVTPFKTLYFDNLTINHWGKKPWPYKISGTGLTEIPVSIINTGFIKLPSGLLSRLEDKTTLIKKILFKLGFKGQTQWFRPMREPAEGLISTATHIITHTPGGVVPTLNMMFHSNEILPGASPYCKTKQDVDIFLNALETTFSYLFQHYEICSIGLSDYSED